MEAKMSKDKSSTNQFTQKKKKKKTSKKIFFSTLYNKLFNIMVIDSLLVVQLTQVGKYYR